MAAILTERDRNETTGQKKLATSRRGGALAGSLRKAVLVDKRAFLSGRWHYAKLRLILDTDNAGNLVIRPTGQDGAVVLTTKDGKRVRYEERHGVISVSEDPAGDTSPLDSAPDPSRN